MPLRSALKRSSAALAAWGSSLPALGAAAFLAFFLGCSSAAAASPRLPNSASPEAAAAGAATFWPEALGFRPRGKLVAAATAIELTEGPGRASAESKRNASMPATLRGPEHQRLVGWRKCHRRQTAHLTRPAGIKREAGGKFALLLYQ
ncbi:hypothetical protein ON010_g18719 [Phytophthora cinnamomi]|nr:hypothetical protein ON010_g18719 [Phytophthora cinnamomi]